MLFRKPSDPPPTLSTYLGLALYTGLILISAWASGASLASTFSLPPLFGFILGLAFSLIAAMLLSSLKKSISDKVVIWILVSLLVFLLAWGASLLTNTHSFFILSNLEDIRKQELQEVSNELDILTTSTESWYNRIRDDFEEKVNGATAQLRKQILAPGNCGVGPESQIIISDLSELLNTTITPQKDPPPGSSCPRAYLPITTAYEENIRELLENRIAKLNADRDRAMSDLDLNKTDSLKDDIDNMLKAYNQYSDAEIEGLLKESFKEVNRQYDIITNRIGLDGFDGASFLPAIPESVELKRIASLPKYIKGNSGYNTSNVMYALLIALLVDLAAFIIFWRYVLPSANDNY